MGLINITANNNRETRRLAHNTKLLYKLGTVMVEELRTAIDRTPLANKRAMKASIKLKVMPTEAVVYSDHDGFHLDIGVRPHQMRYVKNRVIPIALEDAKDPTLKDKRQGVAFRTIVNAPQHPGYPGLRFVERALQSTQDRFLEWVIQDLL